VVRCLQGPAYGHCPGQQHAPTLTPQARGRRAGEWWTTPDGRDKRYLHSPATLTALLEAAGFTGIEVQAHKRRAPGEPGPPQPKGVASDLEIMRQAENEEFKNMKSLHGMMIMFTARKPA
jgi:hypothetical protein